MAKIFIRGLKELQRQLGRSKLIINRHFQNAIKRGSFILIRDLKTGGYVPVDTTKMKQSIRSDISQLKATIAPHTDYAIFVHEGTRFMEGRPFLDEAINRKKRAVEKEFEHATEKITQELAR